MILDKSWNLRHHKKVIQYGRRTNYAFAALKINVNALKIISKTHQAHGFDMSQNVLSVH